MSMLHYFDEYEVGTVCRHPRGRTITESDHMFFCTLTMNHRTPMAGAPRGEPVPLRRRQVAEPLVFSAAVALTVPEMNGKSMSCLGYEEIRHVSPVFYGDTLTAETVILETRESPTRPDVGIVRAETTVHNQRGEIVMVFRREMLVPKRRQAPAAS